MATDGAWLAPRRRGPRPHSWGPGPIRSHLSREPGRAGRGEGIDGYLLIDVHGLRVLAQVVESRESARAVTLEGALAGMLPMRRGYVSRCRTTSRGGAPTEYAWPGARCE